MLKSVLLAISLMGLSLVQTTAQGINMFDQNGNYSYGNVSPGGRVNAYDEHGNYSYGNINPGGQVNMYDQKGNYSSGQINPW